MASKKKGRKAARVGGRKKAATKKAGAKRSAPKRARPKAKPAVAKPVAKTPVAKPAVAKPAIVMPAPRPAPAPVAPAGGVSTRDVNRGHVFSLQPRVNTSFSLKAFDDARRELSDVLYGTIDEAARAVAERALELSNERPDRDPFPPS
jgi:hypothetical protein